MSLGTRVVAASAQPQTHLGLLLLHEEQPLQNSEQEEPKGGTEEVKVSISRSRTSREGGSEYLLMLIYSHSH